MTEPARTYRIYRMNSLTGDIRNYDDFDAFTDDEAIGRAIDSAGEFRIELWRDNRKIVAISGKNGPAELTFAPRGD